MLTSPTVHANHIYVNWFSQKGDFKNFITTKIEYLTAA